MWVAELKRKVDEGEEVPEAARRSRGLQDGGILWETNKL